MNRKINEVQNVPSGSLIEKFLPADYSDVYQFEINMEKEMIPDDIMVSIFTDFPCWINRLFQLRNFLAKFVGLKSSEDDNRKEFEECIRTGGVYGLTSVPAKSDNETVLLLSDKHLNAYISVLVESRGNHKTISATTLVHYNNRLGRIYFFIIRPFHSIIVKSMLKRAVRDLAVGVNSQSAECKKCVED